MIPSYTLQICKMFIDYPPATRTRCLLFLNLADNSVIPLTVFSLGRRRHSCRGPSSTLSCLRNLPALRLLLRRQQLPLRLQSWCHGAHIAVTLSLSLARLSHRSTSCTPSTTCPTHLPASQWIATTHTRFSLTPPVGGKQFLHLLVHGVQFRHAFVRDHVSRYGRRGFHYSWEAGDLVGRLVGAVGGEGKVGQVRLEAAHASGGVLVEMGWGIAGREGGDVGEGCDGKRREKRRKRDVGTETKQERGRV